MELTYYILKDETIKQYCEIVGINQKLLKDIKQKGDILLNNQHVTVRKMMHQGDVLKFILPIEENHLNESELDLKVVYEDEALLVVYKQAGIPCIPVSHYQNDTLANILTKYYKNHHIDAQVHLINRLDKDTRGLMLVAKNRYVHGLMSHTHIERIYRAHVEGVVTEGTINKPILSLEHQMKRIIDEAGKQSITHYKQIGEYVYFKLETGRTHQIRVHMASIRHPLIGDPIYGNEEGEFDLESIRISFIHPITHQIISITKK